MGPIGPPGGTSRTAAATWPACSTASANLAETTRLGLPVPPGFTVTTEAWRALLATGEERDGLPAELSRTFRRGRP